MKIPLVYSAYCAPSNKYYVGQTTDFFGGEPIKVKGKIAGHTTRGRKKDHIQGAKNGSTISPKFYNAIRKHGEDAFHWSIIEYCDGFNKKRLTERENHWILKLNAIRDGYNCATPQCPRDDGYVHSEESRRKISASQKGRPGRKQPDAEKKARSERLKGKPVHPNVHGPEAMAKNALSHLGKPSYVRTPEIRARQSNVAKNSKAIFGRGKGYKHTPEARKNMSIARKGIPNLKMRRKRPPSWGENISRALRGKPNGRLGKKHSEETKLRMSLSMRGKSHGTPSAQTKLNWAAAQKTRREREKNNKLQESHAQPTVSNNI